MGNSRCIFCMSHIERQEAICPVCGKGIWEYQWKETWLEPYTRLHEKYLIGAVLKEEPDVVCYLGYDLILEQKVRIYEYNLEVWTKEKEQESVLLFGKINAVGLAAVKDYFEEAGKGYRVVVYPEGKTLSAVQKEQRKFSEQDALYILEPVMEALNCLHEAGSVHGNLTMEQVILTEDGAVLLPDIKGGKLLLDDTEISPFHAPEQVEEDGICGPWTDIYALCAIWYEMLTGHPLETVRKRREKDRLKNVGHYVTVEAQTEKILSQGLSLEVQTRYFCLGTLMEDLNISKWKASIGQIRHIWGEAWLEAAQKSDISKKKRNKKRYLLKRMAVFCMAMVILTACLAGGCYYYVKSHPEQYFIWKAEKAKEDAGKKLRTEPIHKEDPEYKEVKEYIETYGKKEDGSYKIEQKDAEKCPVDQGTMARFYLDEKTFRQAIEYYLNIDGRMDKKETRCFDYIMIEEDQISLEFQIEEDYMIRKTNGKITLDYDFLDRRVEKVKYSGDQKTCAVFLEKLLPLLVPEMYLTEREAKEMVEQELKEEGISYRFYPGVRVYISKEEARQESEEVYSVEIGQIEGFLTYWQGYVIEVPESGQSYAGNYVRGSKRYKEFVSFVKEQAVSKRRDEEKQNSIRDSEDAMIYTVDEKAVKEWGEPCNMARFFIKKDQMVEGLKECGYQMDKVSEKQRNTVEIQKYGTILTSFNTLEHYQLTDGIRIVIVSDTLDNDVLLMKVCQEKGSDKSISKAVKDIAYLIPDFSTEDEEELLKSIQEEEQKARQRGNDGYIVFDDVTFLPEKEEDGSVYFSIAPALTFDSWPAYWP